MTEVKGVIIQSTAKIILDKFGQYGLKRWLELISPRPVACSPPTSTRKPGSP